VSGSSSRRTVRNYEVDRTISHIREAPGSLRRLSVAVVVDHRQETNAQGQMQRVPLTDEETGAHQHPGARGRGLRCAPG
jgi:flagellar M-ring protein FliF